MPHGFVGGIGQLQAAASALRVVGSPWQKLLPLNGMSLSTSRVSPPS
jgi:hypothetical protein